MSQMGNHIPREPSFKLDHILRCFRTLRPVIVAQVPGLILALIHFGPGRHREGCSLD